MAVQARYRVALAAAANVREVAHRPARADQHLALAEPWDARAAEFTAHVAPQRRHGVLVGRVRGEEAVGQPQRAERERPRRHGLAVLDACDQQAAAPEVEHQSIGDGQAEDGAHAGVTRLGVAAQHLELDAPARVQLLR